jgi:hypothetical protein
MTLHYATNRQVNQLNFGGVPQALKHQLSKIKFIGKLPEPHIIQVK